jgi:DNA ligase 1
MFITRVVLGRILAMGRQQTLGLSLISSFALALIGNQAKFFELPQSVKPTPPQQSSLTEMWGGKKKGQASPVTVVPKSEESGMDIGDDEAIHGRFYVMSFPQFS